MAQQLAAVSEDGFSMPIGQYTEVSDFDKAFGQDMGQEASEELKNWQRHRFELIAIFAITIAEEDVIVFHSQDAIIGDGDTMGVSSQVGEHLFRSAQGRFAVDVPLEAVQVCLEPFEVGVCRRVRLG